MRHHHILGLLCFALLTVGCSVIGFLEPMPQREYYIKLEPVLPDSDEYYADPIDSSVVWSREGVQVKIKLMGDKALDAKFDPRYSPYTLTGVDVAGFDYTPPLWTAFEVTVINRTRERVEFDPTQAILHTDNGRRLLCAQGVGLWYDKDEYYDYSYLKWGGWDGNTRFHAALDRDPIWSRSAFQREKPVRKGSRYSGLITFPPLPMETRSITLDVDDFILAFDRFEVGYGNPTEFIDLQFAFKVDHGLRSAEDGQ
jgi:hypothetical protein